MTDTVESQVTIWRKPNQTREAAASVTGYELAPPVSSAEYD